jgi:pantoate--beta-alanine ligase
VQIVKTVKEMQAIAIAAKAEGRSISFVPTMGFLHEGHLSLMRKARNVADMLVVSIFVNPSQFAPGEDLDRYPRDMKKDESLCAAEAVDILFCPEAEDMYSDSNTVEVDECDLSKQLCGASRPGHFKGVLTVVAKLFNIVQPNIAVFGQKDAQQARVIEQMVTDLNFPVQIVVFPIVRQDDGLAMSSRNTYLSDDERGRALCLYKALCLAEKLYDEGECDSQVIKGQMRELINSSKGDVDYIEILDMKTFQHVSTIQAKTLVALAVKYGSTRLIDNTILMRD